MVLIFVHSNKNNNISLLALQFENRREEKIKTVACISLGNNSYLSAKQILSSYPFRIQKGECVNSY